MKKKVLLVSPPFYRLMGSHYNGMSLGLSYIGSILKTLGNHDVAIYNADFVDSDVYPSQSDLFKNSNEYSKVLKRPYHKIWQEVERTIRDYDPDYLCIQMYTATFKSSYNIAAIAKKIKPSIIILAGGVHPTIDPMSVLNEGIYNYVISGEGEFSTLQLLGRGPELPIPGVSFFSPKLNTTVVNSYEFIQDLDSLPWPMRDGFIGQKSKPDDLGSIITSRGCPFRCTYCASPAIWRNKIRFRTVSNVVAEIGYMVDHLGIKNLLFKDDTFTFIEERAMDILQQTHSMGLDFEWVCDTRADCLTPALLKMMKKTGCKRIKIGVESGSDRILEKIKKKTTVEKILKAVDMIKDEGIPLTIYLMVGFPAETDEDVQKTIKLARKIRADYNSLSVVAPYHGTELYYECENDTIRDSTNWECFFHQSKRMILNDRISQKTIDEFFKLDHGSN